MVTDAKRSPGKLAVYWIASIVIPIAIVLFLGLEIKAAICFGIILLGICCLIFNLLPNYVIGMGIAFIPVLIGITPAATALAPMTTWTWWAIFFGFVVGVSYNKSGLGLRLGNAIARVFVRDWKTFILAIFVFEAILNFIAPFANVASIAIGVSLFMPIARECGLAEKSRGFTGVGLAVALSNTVTGALVMTGHVMNALAVSLFAQYFQITFTNWLYYITPVAIVLSVFAYFAVVLICKPKDSSIDWATAHKSLQSKEKTRFTGDEARVLVLTLIIMVGFLAQSVFKLPFDAGWLSMALTPFFFTPKIGILDASDIPKINWGFVLFMIGVFSIGGQLAYHGVNTALASFAIPDFILTWPMVLQNVYIAVVTTLLHFLCGTFAPLLSTLVPAFGAQGMAAGLSLVGLFGTLICCRTKYIFPFQDAMLMMVKGMTRDQLDDKCLIKVGVAISLTTIIVVIPLASLYWGAVSFV